ncbi:MAG TPA: LON peptidase substrate-binding domain-containing protein [Steroidobacteraceae bacterium]|nr:LON peptidase substrate-binding domain-containing protein [Steroidobacteraceae bacterium]
MSEAALPLFPLNTVLFPGGPLSLRIFEPRYLDMVRRCGREQSAFGVVLILAGAEVGEVTAVADEGTTARLVDFTTRADGLLGIDCVGEQRFRLLRRWQEPDGLNWAEVEYLPAEPPCALPAGFEHLGQLLRELLPRLADAYARVPARYEDAGWVGNRWAELLPLAAADKQRLLELTDPIERLTQVAAWSAGQSATAYV